MTCCTIAGKLRQRLRYAFSEKDHPRDDDGKFSTKEGGDGKDEPFQLKAQPPKAKPREFHNEPTRQSNLFSGTDWKPGQAALFEPDAEPETPNPQTVANAIQLVATPEDKATGTKTTKDGTTWRRAKAGGEDSPVNGNHYKGGQWMPIHGLTPKVEKTAKGKGINPAPTPPKEETENSGKSRQRTEWSEQMIEDERQRREEKEKWDQLNAGPLGKIKWLGENPNGTAINNDRINLKGWKEFAESVGEERLKEIVSELTPIYNKQVNDDDWEKQSPQREADYEKQLFGRSVSGHLKKHPSSMLAKQLVQHVMHNNGKPSIETMIQVNEILKGKTKYTLAHRLRLRYAWSGPQQGPRGGVFWVNSETGEKSYEEPGKRESAKAPAQTKGERANKAHAALQQALGQRKAIYDEIKKDAASARDKAAAAHAELKSASDSIITSFEAESDFDSAYNTIDQHTLDSDPEAPVSQQYQSLGELVTEAASAIEMLKDKTQDHGLTDEEIAANLGNLRTIIQQARTGRARLREYNTHAKELRAIKERRQFATLGERLRYVLQKRKLRYDCGPSTGTFVPTYIGAFRSKLKRKKKKVQYAKLRYIDALKLKKLPKLKTPLDQTYADYYGTTAKGST